ncbi:MAG: SemiSWEET family transporter [Patescibacteria group bacterium]|jgi:uncharacterized protein with PQ loop repeat
MKNKLGIVTLAISLTYMFLGLPSQVIEIWKTQSVKNVSILMFSLLTIQSIFWVAYGIQRKDKFVVIANFFGSLFSAMIVVEYLIFH